MASDESEATMTEPVDDETSISEITIAPDGRIYVFGASFEVLEAIEELASGNSEFRRRLNQIRSRENQ
jgi:hypothetical protein